MPCKQTERSDSFITLNSLNQCSLSNVENLKLPEVKTLLIIAVGDRDKRNKHTFQERQKLRRTLKISDISFLSFIFI